MKKLELKHLAPYLPYNLKFRDSYAGDVSNYTLTANQLAHWEVGHIKPFLPILRPLSDLTTEIEHNGEKFVPGLKLVDPDNTAWDKMICEEYNPFPKIPNYRNYIQVKHETLGQVISINPHNIEHLPYNVFYKLFEWHFDVFGLIEKGLAIDINQL